MDNVRMILCGNVKVSRVNPNEKVGVGAVAFVSADEKKSGENARNCRNKIPKDFI